MHRHVDRRRSTSLFAMGGWLFADLLLALSVIFIAGNTIAYPVPTATPTLFPTATPTPTFTPTTLPAHAPTPTRTPQRAGTPIPRPTSTRVPTPTPVCAPVLDPNAVTLHLAVDVPGLLAGQPVAQTGVLQAFRTAFTKALAARGLAEQYGSAQVGVVETFGTSPSGNRPLGTQIAQRVNAVLLHEPPLTHAVANDFIQSDTPANDVQIRLYLFVRSCA